MAAIGWRAAAFILGNGLAERASFTTFVTNFIAYLTTVMHKSASEASSIITLTFGVYGTTPLLGAFLADAYLGRYATIAIFSLIDLMLFILLYIQKLYTSLVVMAIGSGGIKPCISVFGADQFEKGDPKGKDNLGRFFSVFYMMVEIGSIIAITFLTYIQDKYGWSWGFASLTIWMAIANLIFFIGTPFYRHMTPSGSPFTRLAQVVVAGEMSAIPGSRKIPHTEGLRSLDKAAIKRGFDHEIEGKWMLCTVTQVEELKAIIRLLPICGSTMLLITSVVQLLNYSQMQASIMDRRLFSSFEIPAASLIVFGTIFLVLAVPTYEMLYVPCMRTITGNPHGTSQLQRIGIGLVMSTLSMAVAGFVEHIRRQVPRTMTAFVLLPQFCIFGLAELFGSIGLIEFFYCQAPDGMRSLGTSLLPFSGALGSFFATFLTSVVSSSTRWLNADISVGHLDYYYWLLAVLNVFNFLLFIYCAKRYKYHKPEEFPSIPDGENFVFKVLARFQTRSRKNIPLPPEC